jgi:hypothetical protein
VRAELGFDPRDYDYGPASEAVRKSVATWAQIDWFEPSDTSADRAVELFREHQRRAHVHDPALFPAQLDLRVVTGDRAELAAWCRRVREPSKWNWKYGALKLLSRQHAKTHGWTLKAEARALQPGAPRPGELVFVMGVVEGVQQVIWNPQVFPMPEALEVARDDFSDAASFYISYARHDALDCVKWQLAERSTDPSSNPFLPLLGCYSAGAYPFSLGRDTIIYPSEPNRVPEASERIGPSA